MVESTIPLSIEVFKQSVKLRINIGKKTGKKLYHKEEDAQFIVLSNYLNELPDVLRKYFTKSFDV